MNSEWVLSSGGPRFHKKVFWSDFSGSHWEVIVEASRSEERRRHHGFDDVMICEIYLPSDRDIYNESPQLPSLTVKEPELWAMLEEQVVVMMLNTTEWPIKEEEYRESFAFLARQIQGAKKIMVLGDGVNLVGVLWHAENRFEHTVTIWGQVRRGDLVVKEIICSFAVPYREMLGAPVRPRSLLGQKHSAWCAKLQALVVAYLRDLQRYTSDDMMQTRFLRLIDFLEGRDNVARQVHQLIPRLHEVSEDKLPDFMEALRRLCLEFGILLV